MRLRAYKCCPISPTPCSLRAGHTRHPTSRPHRANFDHSLDNHQNYRPARSTLQVTLGLLLGISIADSLSVIANHIPQQLALALCPACLSVCSEATSLLQHVSKHKYTTAKCFRVQGASCMRYQIQGSRCGGGTRRSIAAWLPLRQLLVETPGDLCCPLAAQWLSVHACNQDVSAGHQSGGS